MDLYEQVGNYVTQHDLIEPGKLIVAGVSGGPDSLTLLDTLSHLGFCLIVAHLDHQLRPDSSAEAGFVANQAGKYGFEFVLGTVPGKSLDQSGVSLEEAARIARYQFLWRTAHLHGADYVAVGHTADDQAETILMHIIRGAGLHGMRGMLPARSMKQWAPSELRDQVLHPILVRPLLEITREQTVQHCSDIDVSPSQDESNNDLSFFRNRIRHELLPLLETYNNSVRTHLQQTGQMMIEYASCLDEEISRTFLHVSRCAGNRSWAVNRVRFAETHAALQRGVLHRILTVLLPEEKDITYPVIDRARAALLAGTPKRSSILGDIHVLQAGGEAVLCAADAAPEFPQYPQLKSGVPMIEFGQSAGEIILDYGWRIIFQFVDSGDIARSEFTADRQTSRERIFFVSEVEGLVLRARSAGDRIVIDKEMHSSKLSDVFIDQHIPEPARNRWPLLVKDGTILWIPGIRRSAEQKIDSSRDFELSVRLDHALSELHFAVADRPLPVNYSNDPSFDVHWQPDSDSIRVMKSLVGNGNIWETAKELHISPDMIVQPALQWSTDNGIDLLDKLDNRKGGSSHYLTAEGLQVIQSYLKYVCKEIN